MAENFGINRLSLGSGSGEIPQRVPQANGPRSAGLPIYICQHCGEAVGNVNEQGICAPCAKDFRDATRRATQQHQKIINKENRAEAYAIRNDNISAVNLGTSLDRRDDLAHYRADTNQRLHFQFARALAPAQPTAPQPVIPAVFGQVNALGGAAPVLALPGPVRLRQGPGPLLLGPAVPVQPNIPARGRVQLLLGPAVPVQAPVPARVPVGVPVPVGPAHGHGLAAGAPGPARGGVYQAPHVFAVARAAYPRR